MTNTRVSPSRIAIVGGGLAGLYAAFRLHQAGVPFSLFEARPRFGGRVLTTGAGLDLGPTWYWPEIQPRMQALIRALGLPVFAQHEEGHALIEHGDGPVRRHPGYRSGNTAMRVLGGTQRLTRQLLSRLPANCLHTNTPVTALHRDDTGIRLHTHGSSVHDSVWDAVWLALPPRLASQLSFQPALPTHSRQRLDTVATWMAPHAKYLARYARPLWREHGLSGDAFSAIGPMGELHDASQGETWALFGFLGLDAGQRLQLGHEPLRARCRAQLGRLFGDEAAHPLEDWLQDWATEPFTATAMDQTTAGGHAAHDLRNVFPEPWNDRVTLIGSEASRAHGGYLEGALMAVDDALGNLWATTDRA